MRPGFTRTKRATDLLDDKAKARIVHVSTSDLEDGVTSPRLSEIFFGVDASDAAVELSPESGHSDSDSDSERSVRCRRPVGSADLEDLIKPIVKDRRDDFRNSLAAHVRKAAQVFARGGSGGKAAARRNVMAYLRNSGYDAAVCETRWDKSGGLAAGGHEFIDVIRRDPPARYVIDLDFGAEFAVARPTDSYERLARHLPAMFVGTAEDLRPILRVASDGARRSLRNRGLCVAPWRKHRFLQNKWLAPCRRSVNVFPAPAATSSLPEKKQDNYGVIKCRAVGFDAAFNGGGGHLFLFPPAARTR